MKYKSTNKSYSLSKDLLQVASILIIIAGFCLWQLYNMVYRDAPDFRQEELESQKSSVINAVYQQRFLYNENGVFSNKISNSSLELEKKLNKNLTRIYVNKSTFIVFAVFSNGSKQQYAIGVLSILNSDQKLSQESDAFAFVCIPKKLNQQLASNLNLTSISDKCPSEYIQTHISLFGKQSK